MVPETYTPADPAPGTQQARFRLTVGERTNIGAEVRVTSGGLLAIGALVSSILLSTAVIVRAARAERPKGKRGRRGKR